MILSFSALRDTLGDYSVVKFLSFAIQGQVGDDKNKGQLVSLLEIQNERSGFLKEAS